MNENKAQNQAIHQAAAKAAEAKTVINGQEMSVKDACAAQEAFEAQNNQTGVQAHHDNSSEAVQAGQAAQNSAMQNMQQHMQRAAVKQSNVQSGQAHLASHIQSAPASQSQQTTQQENAAIQNSIDANAKAKAKTAKKAD